jgi:hypothetical protein
MKVNGYNFGQFKKVILILTNIRKLIDLITNLREYYKL